MLFNLLNMQNLKMKFCFKNEYLRDFFVVVFQLEVWICLRNGSRVFRVRIYSDRTGILSGTLEFAVNISCQKCLT